MGAYKRALVDVSGLPRVKCAGGGRFVFAVAGRDVWGGAVQSVIQQTARRRREWSLGSGDKWPISRWKTQLPVARVTCKDTWPPPQGEMARHTLRIEAECVYVTYDLHHNRLDIQDTSSLQEKKNILTEET